MPITSRPLTEDLVQSILSHPPRPHRHSFQELVILTEGGGEHQIDGQTLSVEAPLAILVAQGKQHQLVPRAGTRGWIINFGTDSLPASGHWIFSQFFAASNLPLERKGHPAIRSAEILHEVLREQPPGAGEASTHLLLALLGLLQAELQRTVLRRASANCGDFRLFTQFLEHLEQHFRTEKGTGFYAKLLGVPPKVLLRLTHTFLGMTLKQLIEERCIGEARRQLYFSDEPIKVIALDLGYQDQSYFTKVFRKATGQSPAAFRQEHHTRRPDPV